MFFLTCGLPNNDSFVLPAGRRETVNKESERREREREREREIVCERE